MLAAVLLLAGLGLAAGGAVLLARGGGGGTLTADLGAAFAGGPAVPAVDADSPGPVPVDTETSGVTTADTGAPGPAPSGTSSQTTEPLAGWQACVNDVYGFALRYPPGWHTAGADAEQDCRFFDPRSFDVGADGPLAVTAVNVFVFAEQTFDDYATQESGDAAVQLEKTDLTIHGRRAQRVEGSVESETGRTRFYEYGLDFDGALVVVTTREGDSPDFAAAKAAVEGMVQSLEAR